MFHLLRLKVMCNNLIYFKILIKSIILLKIHMHKTLSTACMHVLFTVI